MHDSEIQEIISACRTFAATQGVVLPPITIDTSTIARSLSENAIAILTNKFSNMAAKAIAEANKMEAPHWEPGKVICISDTIITAPKDSVQAIGVIVHEMGHAFNIAAGFQNTETNAQVFEIEMLLSVRKKDDMSFDQELDDFFAGRISQYLANDPASSGYVRLHTTIRKLPAVFCKVHEAYNKNIDSHYNTHKKRGSAMFFETTEALKLIPLMERRSSLDPATTYPLIKIADRLPFFLRTKKPQTGTNTLPTSAAGVGYSLLEEKGD